MDERESFLRGYAYGVHAMIDAHEPMVDAVAKVVTELTWPRMPEPDSPEWRMANALHEATMLAMSEVAWRRMAREPHDSALALFQMEWWRGDPA